MPSLPPQKTPFPVKAPFKISSDLYRIGRPVFGYPEDSIFVLDEHFPTYLAAKLDSLKRHPQHCRCFLPKNVEGANGLKQCIWGLLEKLTAEHSQWFDCDGTGFENRLLGIKLLRNGAISKTGRAALFSKLSQDCWEHLGRLSDVERLLDFVALTFQEDLVFVKAGEDNSKSDQRGDCADCFLVTMPTHWDPQDKIGLDFSSIHRPVADRAVLDQAHPNLIKAMINQGPFFRYNWSLTSVNQLSLNPNLLKSGAHSLADEQLAGQGSLIDRLYFRVERQTVSSFPDLSRCVFGIRIYQQPLAEAVATDGRRIVLADAIASMSEEVIRYRSMQAFAGRLVDQLRQV